MEQVGRQQVGQVPGGVQAGVGGQGVGGWRQQGVVGEEGRVETASGR